MPKEKNNQRSVINEGDLSLLLQEYRELAGYSLNQMAEALCLSDTTLEKLENEDFDDLAEPPYIRGYLRNYAKLAEKDPIDLITRYESLRGADPSDLDYHFRAKPTILTGSKRKISPVMAQLLLLSLLLALLVGISMIPAVNKWITSTWSSFSEQTSAQSGSYIENQDLIGSMPVPEPLPLEAPSEEKKEAPSSTATELPATSQTNNTDTQNTNNNNGDQTTTPQSTSPETQTQNDSTTENTQDAINSDTVHLKLIFNKEVWMRIKDGNNKTVFEGLNAAGGSKDVSLKKPLHFKVGNAQGLSLFVDDRPVDISSYIKGSVANFSLE